MSWLQIRSWHLVDYPPGSTAGGHGWELNFKTLCGRLASLPSGEETLAQPPEEERTCERCFQVREVRNV
jgi:hypothetical protein